MVRRFVIGGVFFFSFSFLSLPSKITAWPLLLWVFQLQSLFFLFLIYFLGFFVKILLVFNFIIQSKFMVLFFLFLLFSLLFVIVSFIVFNFIIQTKFIIFSNMVLRV